MSTRAVPELWLFSTDPAQVVEAVAGGARGAVIDWESDGKRERQAGADTQIGTDTLDDLRRVRAATSAPVICRTDRVGRATREQVAAALGEGADEVLLPMVRCVEEVERVLDQVAGRAGVGILVETRDAVSLVADLARLPLSRVYVGLNDLSIERGTACIFATVADGTVERVRQAVERPFGFGGLTLPDGGTPIPSRLLAAEMVRLDCAFTFLRRSFHRDSVGIGARRAVERILAGLEETAAFDARRLADARAEFRAAVAAWRRPAAMPAAHTA